MCWNKSVISGDIATLHHLGDLIRMKVARTKIIVRAIGVIKATDLFFIRSVAIVNSRFMGRNNETLGSCALSDLCAE